MTREIYMIGPFFLAFFMFAAGCKVSASTVSYKNRGALLSSESYYPSSPKVTESLLKGEKLIMETQLQEGVCYAFLAAADSAGAGMTFSLHYAKKKVDKTCDGGKSFTMIYYCAERDGSYKLKLEFKEAGGSVMVGVWKKGGGPAAEGAGRQAGTCSDPYLLELGQEIRSSTEGLSHELQGPCIQGKAPDAVFKVVIEEQTSFVAELETGFDSGLYLLDRCDREGEALACSDDFEMRSGSSRIQVSLDPGVYYLVVDGFGEMSGEFTLKSSVIARMSPHAMCQEAPAFEPGKVAEGSTAGKPDTFHGSCAQGTKGPDTVYAVEIAETSHVRFILETPNHDGALHLHKDCPGSSLELGCNDDFETNRKSMIQARLDPGKYTLVVDGFDGMASGDYTLRMDAFSDFTERSADDKCASAPGLEGISKKGDQTITIRGSTFFAEDDGQPGCAQSPGGADIFRSFHLPADSIVSIRTKSAQFAGLVVSLMGECGGKTLACRLDGVETMLKAGDYVLSVDSLGADQTGDFELDMRVQSVDALSKACKGGSALASGKVVKGVTKGAGSFMGTCGGLGFGPENVHVLKIKKKSSVRIEVNPEGFDSVIYIRRQCVEKSSEIACNDDAGSVSKSVLETTLEKGAYYVIVDGCRVNDAGSYSIKAIVK